MGFITITEEFSSSVPAEIAFKAFVLDADKLLPKIAPHAIKSIETIHGDGGPGSIKKITIAQGSETKFIKHRVDILDKVNMKYGHTIIEGEPLMGKLESISHEVQWEASPNGGCKGKEVSKYYPKPGVIISEQEVKAEKAKATAIFKDVEAYLLANPHTYA